jgi:hypothetical protein
MFVHGSVICVYFAHLAPVLLLGFSITTGVLQASPIDQAPLSLAQKGLAQ